MRTILLSFKADVYKRVLSGEKIYEHRRVFPNDTITAYLYISTPVKAITGIMHLNNKVDIVSWKERYSGDKDAVQRIENYLKHYKVAMEITDFQPTNLISLEQLRCDVPRFVVPQMYYYLENSFLLSYLNERLMPDGDLIQHEFSNITSDLICKS